MKHNAIVTGGTDGVGKATAKELVKLGYHVIIVGQNEEKGQSVVNEISLAVPEGHIQFWRADLSLISEVSRIAKLFLSQFDHLDILVLCAFQVQLKYKLTSEGFEKTFALHYLSRFALIQNLDNVIGVKGETRIIDFAVPGNNYGDIDLTDLTMERKYSAFKALKRGHFFNDLMAVEYSKRASNKQVTFILASPGTVATGIANPLPQPFRSIIKLLMQLFATSPDKFAEIPVYYITDKPLKDKRLRVLKRKKEIILGASSQDSNLAQELWEKSIQLIHAVDSTEH